MSGPLPNAYSAIVPDEKVRDYLLDPAHSDNQGKAGFFNRFGFTRLRWTILRDALCDHPRTNLLTRMMPSHYGVRYRVRCSLSSPDGRNP